MHQLELFFSSFVASICQPTATDRSMALYGHEIAHREHATYELGGKGYPLCKLNLIDLRTLNNYRDKPAVMSE